MDAITYGYVHCQVVQTVADSADTDRYPDTVPAKGTVKFKREKPTQVSLVQDNPAVVDVADQTFDLDATGVMTSNQKPGAWLAVGRWHVSIFIGNRPIADFPIDLTADFTESNPMFLPAYLPQAGAPQAGAVVAALTVPLGGLEGQVLARSADGSLMWTVPTGTGTAPTSTVDFSAMVTN